MLAAIALAGATVLLLLGAPDHDSVPKARARAQSMAPQVVSITLATRAPARAVPGAFLGLSTEYWAAQTFERRPALFARVLRLIHVPGDDPEVLRIGGDSADHSFYEPDVRTPPPWMFAITPRWLRDTGALLRRADARVMLDLNLVTGSPVLAARWASAAYRELPRGSLAGFEIGNEPDIYSRSYWRAIVGRGSPWARALPIRLSAAAYDLEYQSYARAVGSVAPGVPLSGPVLANPGAHVDWIPSLLAADRGAVATVTGHRYPLSACVKPRSPIFPTVARVLSERASAGMAHRFRPAVELAHSAGLPFPAVGAQLGHVRRASRRQRHVRDRPLGSRCAVRADARRRRCGRRPCPRRRDQRRVHARRVGPRGPAAPVRADPVHADARSARAPDPAAPPRRSGSSPQGLGGAGVQPSPERAADQQGRSAGARPAAAPRHRRGERSASARPGGRLAHR